MFSWLFGGSGDDKGKKPADDIPKPADAARPSDPIASIKSNPDGKLDLYDPLILERISQAAKELQKSGRSLR